MLKLALGAAGLAMLAGMLAVLAGMPTVVAAGACVEADPADLSATVADSDLIVTGTVMAESGGAIQIRPEAYLKGAASGDAIRPVRQDGDVCRPAALADGSRVLAFLASSKGAIGWPSEGRVFTLADGDARRVGAPDVALREADLIARVRALTDQYAVPASSEGEGASIDWLGTILPVGLALAGIMAAGLVLMRTWHRIDPS